MLTLLLYALLAIIVIAGLFALAVFVLPKGEQLAPPTPDTRPWEALPDRQLVAEDVVAARLPVALRGYRFAETDLLLDRLTDELRLRDDEIARLRGARPSTTGLPGLASPALSSYGPVSQYETTAVETPPEPRVEPLPERPAESTAELPVESTAELPVEPHEPPPHEPHEPPSQEPPSQESHQLQPPPGHEVPSSPPSHE